MNRTDGYEIIRARDAHIHALLTPEENKMLRRYRRRRLCLLWGEQIATLVFLYDSHLKIMKKFHDFHSRRRRRMGMHETDFVPFYGTKWRVR